MAIPGHSTKLEYGEGGSVSVEIDKIEELTPGEIAVDDIETSHMQSVDQFKTYMAGWKDPGEIAGTCQHDPAQYNALLGIVGDDKSWQITLQDGSKINFDGYLKGLGSPVEREGKVLTSFTIKASGKPTFTPGAS